MKGQKQDKFLVSYGVYILSLLIFGTNGLYVAHISLAGSQIALLRTMIGGILLTGLVLFGGGFDKNNIRKEWGLLLLGGATLGLDWIALFEAYKMLNVSLATLLYYAGPAIVLLFSPVLFSEKLTKQKTLSVFLVGVGLVCISGSVVVVGTSALGLIPAVLSGVLYATLIVFNKRIVHTNGMQTAAIELNIAFVVIGVYTLCTAGLPHISTGDLPYIAGIGLINTGFAYWVYFVSLQKLPGQSVALISYIDPVSALLFSSFFLYEAMTPVQVSGAVLIVGGAVLGEIKIRDRARIRQENREGGVGEKSWKETMERGVGKASWTEEM